MTKAKSARPEGNLVQDPEVVSQIGTLCFKTEDRLCVMNGGGDFWYLEYKSNSVHSKWLEGKMVRVYYTNEFRKQVVTMEAVEPTQEGA